MIATTGQRSTERWLRRNAPDVTLSPAARTLLEERLAAARRCRRPGDAVWLVGAVALLVALVGTAGGTDHGNALLGVAYVTVTASLILTSVGQIRLDRAERALGAAEPQRVAATEHAGPVAVLGFLPTAVATVSILAYLGWTVALAIGGGLVLAAGFAGWFALAGGTALADLRRILRRPTLAVDEPSLVVDRRLRIEGALAAASRLVTLWVATGVIARGWSTSTTPDTVPSGLTSTCMIMALLGLWAFTPPTWTRTRRPSTSDDTAGYAG